MKIWSGVITVVLFFTRIASAQQNPYPQQYFRHPLNIPMQLVANFGEIRTNHWHMGLDIRTQQRVNLPVFAAADGFISRMLVEPGGFGQAIYIDHPNGYTTLYAHMNSFFPALSFYIKQRQYELESWRINIDLPPNLFKVKKGDFIGNSGSTGASEGPHVHFEIRDTKTGNCLNPLLFNFPIADGIPPTISRLAMYDRNRSTYDQNPQLLALRRTGNQYTITNQSIRVGTNRVSFAVGATDRFTAIPNPNGIFSAQVFVDGNAVSGFSLDDISYNDTRYINAQLDFPYKSRGGAALQHISPLPGAKNIAYYISGDDGVIELKDDLPHDVIIEVKDAAQNVSKIQFRIQYDESIGRTHSGINGVRFFPNHVNVFESDQFEIYTSVFSIYDTVKVAFNSVLNQPAGAVSPLFQFLGAAIPSHDSVTVRIRPEEGLSEWKDRIVIRNMAGTRTYLAKASWLRDGWISARFRQFGTYQAFVDTLPPLINNPPLNLTKSSRIVFTPTDNFKVIKNFRAELDGQWLRFTNDKGKTWIYTFDEKFPRGQHELKVSVEDEAGNTTIKTWRVTR